MAQSKHLEIAPESSTKVFVMGGKGSLAKLLGVPQLFAIGYGDVGSSIYYALGVTTLFALGATPLAILVAGLFFACTVSTYAELASTYPEAGGSQIFARRAFGDMVSFFAGWCLLLDYILTIAISAYTVSPYLDHFLGISMGKELELLVSVALIAGLTMINIMGVKESGGMSLILAVIDIVVLSLIILVGGYFLFDFKTVWNGVASVGHEPTWGSFFHGISLAMVAYTGIEATAQLAGESKDPARQIPRAMTLVLLCVLVMYLAVTAIALSAMTPHELSTKWLEDPMAGIASKIPVIGGVLSRGVSLLGVIVLTVATNAGIIGASRLAYSMGGHFQLPHIFVRIHPSFKTPYLAIAIFSGIAAFVIMMARRLDILADLYNFGAMLAFFLAHLSLIGLRVRDAGTPRPYRSPFNISVGRFKIPLTAIAGLLATAGVWLIVVFKHPHGRWLGFSWLFVGGALYLAYRSRSRLPVTKTLDIEKVDVAGFNEVKIKKILFPSIHGDDLETLQFACNLAKNYGADLSAIHVIEAKAQAPLDTFYPDEFMQADNAMERIQAVSREFGLPTIESKILQSRSVADTIVEYALEGKFDLIVLGAKVSRPSPVIDPAGIFSGGVGRFVEQIMKNAPCRVCVLKV